MSTTLGQTDWIFLIIIVVLLLAWMIFGPRWLALNAAKKVLRYMKKMNAVNPELALSAEQMGIIPLPYVG